MAHVLTDGTFKDRGSWEGPRSVSTGQSTRDQRLEKGLAAHRLSGL